MPNRTEVTTPSEFMRLLDDCGILRPDELQAARRVMGETRTSKLMARRLVAKGLLTRWQAGQLLVGWAKLRLGNYKLCRQIGRGHFGRVFLAEHIRLRREVAIKTLSRRFTQRQEIVDQFLNDARETAALDHRNLVHVLDVDSADDQYFVVMEYVLGEDLQRRVERDGALAPHDAADYVCQAADGLQYAHEANLYHRDVRPANLMLDEKGEVKVLGLGVGNLTVPEPSDVSEEVFDVSDDYRAPEQRHGATRGDARSDIYSLGCSAGYLLTGQPPVGVLGNAASNDATAKEPTFRWELVQPEVPSTLVEIVQKTMAIEPEERYETARDVCNALLAWRDENPESTQPTQVARPTARFTGVAEHPVPTVDRGVPKSRGQESKTRGMSRRWNVVVAASTFCALIALTGYCLWPDRTAKISSVVTTKEAVADTLKESSPPKVEGPGNSEEPIGPETTLPEAGSGHETDLSKKNGSKAIGGKPATDLEKLSKAIEATAKPPAPKKKTPATDSSTAKKPIPFIADNPFQAMPAAIDLPAFEDTADEPSRRDLVSINVSLARKLRVTLLGGEHAPGRSGRFTLKPLPRRAAPNWVVSVHGSEANSEAGLPIARLTVEDDQLRFRWESAASQHPLAPKLGNCVLRFAVQKHVHDLRLRTASEVEPLSVDLRRMSNSDRWPVKNAPDARHVRFEITQLDEPFPNVFNLDPVKPIVPDGEKVLVKIGGGDLDDHVLLLELTPQLPSTFRLEWKAFFQIIPSFDPMPLTQKNLENVANLVAQKQIADNRNAQKARLDAARTPRSNPQRKAMDRRRKQYEAELEMTAKATARVEALRELRRAMADGAALHFRLYYLADDCEVDLLSTKN